jgi:T-complex protein 1 subunit delta
VSKAQDVEAGDGTTSVVILTGSLLDAAQQLLNKGIHPTIISESFQQALKGATEILKNMSDPVDLADRDSLLKSATTSLSSKVVSQYSNLLSPIAVDAVLRVVDPKTSQNVDLRDIRVVKKLGGTIDETELVDGIVFAQKASHVAGGPSRITNAKIGLIQFCLSAPKTNVSSFPSLSSKLFLLIL